LTEPPAQFDWTEFLGRNDRQAGGPIVKLSRKTSIAVVIGFVVAFVLPMAADFVPPLPAPTTFLEDLGAVVVFTAVMLAAILVVRYRVERRQALELEPTTRRLARVARRWARGILIYLILVAATWILLTLLTGTSDTSGRTAFAFAVAVPVSIAYGLWRRYDRRRNHEPSRRMAVRLNSSGLTMYQRRALARCQSWPRVPKAALALTLHFATFLVLAELIGASRGPHASGWGPIVIAAPLAVISVRLCGLYFQRGVPDGAETSRARSASDALRARGEEAGGDTRLADESGERWLGRRPASPSHRDTAKAGQSTTLSLQAPTRVRVHPSVAVALGVFVAYLAVKEITVAITASSVSYPLADITAANVRDATVIPFGVAALLVIAVVTVLGWWHPVLFERRSTPAWMLAIPVVSIGCFAMGVATADPGAFAASHLAYLIVGFALVAFCEEVMTRGVLLVGFRSGYREIYAYLATTSLFALMHGLNFFHGQGASTTVGQIIEVFFVGTLFYAIRRTSGTLILAIVAHALFDLALVVHAGPGKLLNSASGGSPWATGGLTVGLILAVVGVRRLFGSGGAQATSDVDRAASAPGAS